MQIIPEIKRIKLEFMYIKLILVEYQDSKRAKIK